MRKTKKKSDLPEEALAAAEAGAGAPQELLPGELRAEVVVHQPKMTRVDRMVPLRGNPNVQDAAKFHELIEDMQASGFSGAVEVVPFEENGEERFLIVHGEWRWKAACALQVPEIPASHLTHPRFKDRDFQLILAIRRNVIHGKFDKGKFRAAVAELATAYPDSEELRRALAFTAQEDWNRLVGQTREALKKQGATPEMMERFEEKARDAKSLADLSVIVSRLYELHRDTVPFGYMVFTYGRQEHFYVAGTKTTLAALKAVCAHAKARGVEVNSLLGPAFTALDEKLRREAVAPATGPAPALDGPF